MNKFFSLLLIYFFCILTQAQQSTLNLIIGTYTNNCESKGIYVYNFNTETGETIFKASSESIINPSFLTVSKDKKFIYSVNEDGVKSTVSTFQFASDTGKLKLQQQLNSEGADPCFIINDEKQVILATYSSGSISVFDKLENGGLEFQQKYSHTGKSTNVSRQEKSHIHMVQFSPDNKYLLATDLGADFIYVYKYNPLDRNNFLEPKNVVKVKSGSGPRHFAFSKNGKYVYLLQELDGTVSVFEFNNGNLKLLQETTVVAKDFKGDAGAADIHISPDGRFLYATNRGKANDIACFEIKKNGTLKHKFNTSTLGIGPRNFSIDPSGKFLLVANQFSNEVVIFKIDKKNGNVTDTGKRIDLCSPVCLVFD